MVTVGKSLITSHYTGEEFDSALVLNPGVTIERLNEQSYRTIRRNSMCRSRSQARARRSTKF